MTIRQFAPAAALLLLIGCASSTVGVSGGDGDTTGSASAVMGEEIEAGADELRVDVTLPDPPPVMPNDTSVDFDYIFEIRNTGTTPAKIRRINLSSAGGTYRIDRSSRTFKNVIEPGATEKIAYWARATNIDPNLGIRGPMTLRAEIEFENAGGVKKGVYVRNVSGAGAIGVTRTP